MANEEKKCPMDCARCSFRQNVYCASQIGLSSYEVITRLEEKIEKADKKLDVILEKVEGMMEGLDALQADMLMAPVAQEEEAAQTIGSLNNQTKTEKL